MATFLLEIRTEEIPANALPGARRQLGELFAKHLDGHQTKLEFDWWNRIRQWKFCRKQPHH